MSLQIPTPLIAALAWATQRGRRSLDWARGRVPSSLMVALLAALVAHGLVLAHGGLRRGGATPDERVAAAKAADDTPELLRFSRRSALPPSLSTIPIPPAAPLPPPPVASPAGESDASAAPAGRRSQPTTAAARGQRVSTTVPRGNSSGRGGRRGQRPNQTAAGARDDGARAALGPAQLAEASTNLESLAHGTGGEGGTAAAAQSLWEQAAPMGEAKLAPGQELRRLPAAALRELGLAAGSRLILPSEGGRSLVVWLEGDQAWLLRGQAAADGDGDRPAAEG